MSITYPKGFVASGMASGIKGGGVLDLALVASGSRAPVAAAATFTTNASAAAPVNLSRSNLAASGGKAAGVLINSGCANAATGDRGVLAAQRSADVLASALGVSSSEVLICSTGLIGRHLDVDRIEAVMAQLVTSLDRTEQAGLAAATAILTTDTHPKQVIKEGFGCAVGGMAKGAGMIAPNMATMLVVLTTDAKVEPNILARSLRAAVKETFNELSVDGCMSTNDTVSCLASGLGNAIGERDLTTLLKQACADLALQLAADAEGTTKVARFTVTSAMSQQDARLCARQVGESLLVKTSLHGSDPYWGRVVSELGASGAAFDLGKVTISYGETVVFANGDEVVLSSGDKAILASYMAGHEIDLICDLGLGSASATLLGTDLGHGYVEENMRTS